MEPRGVLPPQPASRLRTPIQNRDRLLNSAVAQRFFAEVNRQAKRFMSDEHFTVDGTLIQAWASQMTLRSLPLSPRQRFFSVLS